MPRIFISYRREDSQYVTDSIYDHMVKHFGSENVFLDVGNIPAGVDFRKHLQDQISTHDVVLVIIGPDWGRLLLERSNQSNDFVRIEIENALKQDKFVIPVLVMSAKLPSFSNLPTSIQELQWHNAATIRRQPDFGSDCERLANDIRYVTSTSKPYVASIDSLAGQWVDKSDGDTVYFIQTGNRVVGLYDFAQKQKTGVYLGNVNNDVLEYQWRWLNGTFEGSGKMSIYWKEKRISGNWWYDNDKKESEPVEYTWVSNEMPSWLSKTDFKEYSYFLNQQTK